MIYFRKEPRKAKQPAKRKELDLTKVTAKMAKKAEGLGKAFRTLQDSESEVLKLTLDALHKPTKPKLELAIKITRKRKKLAESLPIIYSEFLGEHNIRILEMVAENCETIIKALEKELTKFEK